jgi:hypothetical protein
MDPRPPHNAGVASSGSSCGDGLVAIATNNNQETICSRPKVGPSQENMLALLSTLRLHKVQSMMNLRQVLESGASAAFAIANPGKRSASAGLLFQLSAPLFRGKRISFGNAPAAPLAEPRSPVALLTFDVKWC